MVMKLLNGKTTVYYGKTIKVKQRKIRVSPKIIWELLYIPTVRLRTFCNFLSHIPADLF